MTPLPGIESNGNRRPCCTCVCISLNYFPTFFIPPAIAAAAAAAAFFLVDHLVNEESESFAEAGKDLKEVVARLLLFAETRYILRGLPLPLRFFLVQRRTGVRRS